jgi:hypothetical protein
MQQYNNMPYWVPQPHCMSVLPIHLSAHRNYQKRKVVGLERGPLSLLSTREELLDRKVAVPV